jgi:hypothetical protein
VPSSCNSRPLHLTWPEGESLPWATNGVSANAQRRSAERRENERSHAHQAQYKLDKVLPLLECQSRLLLDLVPQSFVLRGMCITWRQQQKVTPMAQVA